MPYSVDKIRHYLSTPHDFHPPWTHHLYDIFSLLLASSIFLISLSLLLSHFNLLPHITPRLRSIGILCSIASAWCVCVYMVQRVIGVVMNDPADVRSWIMMALVAMMVGPFAWGSWGYVRLKM